MVHYRFQMVSTVIPIVQPKPPSAKKNGNQCRRTRPNQTRHPRRRTIRTRKGTQRKPAQRNPHRDRNTTSGKELRTTKPHQHKFHITHHTSHTRKREHNRTRNRNSLSKPRNHTRMPRPRRSYQNLSQSQHRPRINP